MSSCLVVMSLAFSLRSCREESASAWPSVFVLKTASRCQASCSHFDHVCEFRLLPSINPQKQLPGASPSLWLKQWPVLLGEGVCVCWGGGTLDDDSWDECCHRLWQSRGAFRQQLLMFSSIYLLRHGWLVTQPRPPNTTGWTDFRGHHTLIELWIR